MRRFRTAAALLSMVAAAGCGDGGGAETAPPPAPTIADTLPEDTALPVVETPPPGQPWTPEDSARAVIADSVYETRLMRRRAASMEDLASCLAKVRDVDAPQRAVLEAACRRSRPQEGS